MGSYSLKNDRAKMEYRSTLKCHFEVCNFTKA